MKEQQYSVIDQPSFHEEPILAQFKSSSDEVPIKELSGDEAIEKSFMTFSGQSSTWVKRNTKASFLLTSITIMKSMVGVGILGIPNVMKNFGIFITILVMFCVFCLGIFVSNLMLKNKNLSKRSNYSTIGFFVFRHRWIIWTVNLVIILSNLGTCMSELIIFGDTTQLLIKYYHASPDALPWYFNRSLWIVAIGILLFPLLVVKSIEKLRFVSLTAILSISTFTVLVIYNFFRIEETPEGFSFWLPDKFDLKSALAALPTIILAYNWQFNLFPIYKGMEDTSDRKMLLAFICGYSMATVLYLTVGILGYATYGYNIETNYLKSISSASVGGFLYVVLNLTFVISTTLTMPVLFFGGRNNFIQLIKSIFNPQKTVISADAYQKSLDQENKLIEVRLKKRNQVIKFYGFSAFLFILIELGAIFLDNLGLVFNLKGAIFCNAIQFVLPTLYYIGLVRKIKRYRFPDNRKKLLFYWVICLFFLSWVFMFVCVVSEVLKSRK